MQSIVNLFMKILKMKITFCFVLQVMEVVLINWVGCTSMGDLFLNQFDRELLIFPTKEFARVTFQGNLEFRMAV